MYFQQMKLSVLHHTVYLNLHLYTWCLSGWKGLLYKWILSLVEKFAFSELHVLAFRERKGSRKDDFMKNKILEKETAKIVFLYLIIIC